MKDKCKECGAEVEHDCRKCPECGKEFPTLGKTKWWKIVIPIFILIGIFDLLNAPNSKVLTKEDYGSKWPLKVNSAEIKCYKENDIEMPTIIINGEEYGLTGFAAIQKSKYDANEVDKFVLPGEYKNMLDKNFGLIMDEAKKLCD